MYHAVRDCGLPEDRLELHDPMDEDATVKDASLAMTSSDLPLLARMLSKILERGAAHMADVRLEISMEIADAMEMEVHLAPDGYAVVTVNAGAINGDMARRIANAQAALGGDNQEVAI
jgi:hypothetical protein